MTAEGWRNKVGDSAFNHVRDAMGPATTDAQVACVLDAAHEVGWRAPEAQPIVSLEKTKVTFPGAPSTLTSLGFAQWCEEKGHGWVIFRVPQLARAITGPWYSTFADIWAAYCSECEVDLLEHQKVIPANAWSFLGGSGAPMHQAISTVIMEESPRRNVQMQTFKS